MADSNSSVEYIPTAIFNASSQEKIKYFQEYTLAHPKLMLAYEQLISAIKETSSKSLIYVIGPTGIGKTTLITQACQKIINSQIKVLEQDKGFIPIFGIEAPAPEMRNFDWKDFYLRALYAIGDPFYRPDKTYRYTKNQLRMQLERALRNRNPRAFYIQGKRKKKVSVTC